VENWKNVREASPHTVQQNVEGWKRKENAAHEYKDNLTHTGNKCTAAISPSSVAGQVFFGGGEGG
jgi:hypothetical protein